jgi:hypothetical protein
MEYLCSGLFKMPLRLVAEGVSRKQRSPRAEPKSPLPPQEQTAVDEVFDERAIWKAT